MNVRDSEVIAGLLTAGGYRLATDPDSADVIILNTCSVRQHAEDRVWSQVGSLSKLRTTDDERRTTPRLRSGQANDGHKPIIGLVGCMAQNYQDEVFQRAPEVDFVVGPADIAKIPSIIGSFFTDDGRRKTKDGIRTTDDGRRTTKHLLERKVWETGGATRPEEIYHTGFYQDKEHAYVVISEGCSNYCSYCVVPYVRGALRHRDHRDILREIEAAVAKGISKVTLLGQNVNAYKSTVDFAVLLEMVNKIKGLKEFTIMTSHPKDTTVGLFKVMQGLDKLVKHLHLPLQSGSDRILELMNRGYSKRFYLDLAQNYRKIVNGVLTTDIIVGFPTETEKDFQDTFDLVRRLRFGAAYIFKYSPRPGTRAAGMPDDVALEEKQRRHCLMLELQKGISKTKDKI